MRRKALGQNQGWGSSGPLWLQEQGRRCRVSSLTSVMATVRKIKAENVAGFVCLFFVCQQDYVKTVTQISSKLGGRMERGPMNISIHFGVDPEYLSFIHYTSPLSYALPYCLCTLSVTFSCSTRGSGGDRV